MAQDDSNRVKLTAWVSKGLRLRFKTFCLPRDVDMQDILRVMVEKFLAEAEAEEQSQFVKEILSKVTPPAATREVERRKVVPMPRRDGRT